MSERPPLRKTPGFAGLEFRAPTPEQKSSAVREHARFKADRRLVRKLDELLGPVDEEEEP